MTATLWDMTRTLTTSPVVIDGLVFRCNDTATTRRIVAPESWDIVPEGTFVVEDAVGYRTYCVLTGRTRKFWGIDCPTIDRFEITTTVGDLGNGPTVIGVPGARMPGTWAIRPQYVV